MFTQEGAYTYEALTRGHVHSYVTDNGSIIELRRTGDIYVVSFEDHKGRQTLRYETGNLRKARKTYMEWVERTIPGLQ